ncbi:MAG: type II secretion system protein GspC [Dokdonella sp.]
MAHPLLARTGQRWIERAALLASLLLILAIVWFAVRIALALWPRGDAAANVAPARLPEANANAPTVSVSRWHLFGNAGASATNLRVLPTSTLALSLRGTVADRDPTVGVAVIGDGQNERAYRVGDDIDSGVSLVEVHTDHVVISRDGVRESLQLPREATGAQPGPVFDLSAANSSNKPANAANGTNSAAAAAPNYAPPQLANGAVNWQQTLDQVQKNPAQFAQLAAPVIQDGKLLGLRVRGLDPATMTKLGLEAGDLVTAVNGIAIDSPQRATEILSSVQNAASVRVTVQRNGQPVDLTIGKN